MHCMTKVLHELIDNSNECDLDGVNGAKSQQWLVCVIHIIDNQYDAMWCL